MIMNEKELLNQFLNGFPNETHPKDSERFLAYAVECAKHNHYIDIEEMSKRGVSNERIEELQIAFDWIKSTVDYLSKARIS